MGHRTGLTFKTVGINSSVPATAKEIVEAYKEASENMIAEIKEKWNDDTLNITDDMSGENWKRRMDKLWNASTGMILNKKAAIKCSLFKSFKLGLSNLHLRFHCSYLFFLVFRLNQIINLFCLCLLLLRLQTKFPHLI